MKVYIAQINPTTTLAKEFEERLFEHMAQAQKNSSDLIVFSNLYRVMTDPFGSLNLSTLVKSQEKLFKQIQKRISQGVGVVLEGWSSVSSKEPPQKTLFFLEKGKPWRELKPSREFTSFKNTTGPMRVLNFKKESLGFLLGVKDLSFFSTKLLKKPNTVFLLSSFSYHKFFRDRVVSEFSTFSKKNRLAMVCVNRLSFESSQVFYGGSFAIDRQGHLSSQLEAFSEDAQILDIQVLNSQKKVAKKLAPRKTTFLEHLQSALVFGIKDYLSQNNFQKVHLGISGGLDSALVAYLATQAVGPANVKLIALPGPYSSQLSFDLALRLAENLGVEFLNADINSVYRILLEEMGVSFGYHGEGLVGENLQARIRGLFLMAYSNMKGSLLLATSNKSEISVGFTTLYGDMCGGLAPIADLYKTEVIRLCEFINRKKELIPAQIITRPPSAELRDGQVDEDSLPPYKVLDPLLKKIWTLSGSVQGASQVPLVSQVLISEFKRRQMAPIIKVADDHFMKINPN